MPFAEQSSVEANELTISHSTIQSGIAFSVEDLKEVARNLQGSHVELQHHIQQLLERQSTYCWVYHSQAQIPCPSRHLLSQAGQDLSSLRNHYPNHPLPLRSEMLNTTWHHGSVTLTSLPELMPPRQRSQSFPGSIDRHCTPPAPYFRRSLRERDGSKDGTGSALRSVSRNISNPPASFVDSFCDMSCRCSCHYRAFRQLNLLNGIFGSFLIGWTRQPLSQVGCNERMCIRRSTPAVSVEYYSPWWINIGAVHVHFTYGASPRVALSFPSIRPPDADFFVYIRTGQCERIKELFIEGRASVADIAAPYGLSPLLLAILYDQMDAYRLLISAGAYRITPVASHTRCIDLWRFWEVFPSSEYSLSATEIVRDYVNLCSLEPQAKALSSISTELSLERHNFTRLHKAVLRLTAEPFDRVLRTSRASIDSRDSLGRTALHLAAYNRDANDIDIILRHGANPDLGDRHGKTPLHVASALGSASCTNALIAGGANLESTDQFGDTALHHACMRGHVHIVELLLKAGADTEAQNCVGETPLRHAVFCDHILVVQLLHERGAAFAPQDKWGSTALHNAIMFNSHSVLCFLLAIKMRTDQNYYSGRTVLHILGESADLRTLEICQNAGLEGIDVAAVNAQGFSALDCLRQRRDADLLIEPFGALLMSMSASANEPGERSSLTFDVVEDTSEEGDSVEDFMDAMEVQPVA